jgi:GT2 family glycosyltransferase
MDTYPMTQSMRSTFLQGAFFFTRRSVLDKVGWFDESYFLDGEDIDLCWKIKEEGYRIVYYPWVSITHFKGASKGKVDSALKKRVPFASRLKFRMAGVNSMEHFYRKRLWDRYPLVFKPYGTCRY